jgi:hypothetical protein
MKFVLLFFLLGSWCLGHCQGMYVISKKQTARSKDYIYRNGDKMVIGFKNAKRVGVFFVENDTTIRFNDSLISLAEVDWVMVKRSWAEKIAQLGLKWGTTYFLTFAINDWYRTGDPFATNYTGRNSGILVSVGIVALALSLKRCRAESYNYFLVE